MSIEHHLSSLFSRTAHGIKPGLEVTEALLEKLGNPHRDLKIIHVCGTNGKGSVCAMIESVLRASGFKTGLYTSPHLIDFNERFRVNGKNISDSTLESLIIDIEAVAQFLEPRPATFFELSTAIAFEHFRREKVDYAVIETGMGGRWDATNVGHPILSIITRIDVDHANYLGTDIQQIATEKAGIIQTDGHVICGPMPVEAEAIIYREASEKNVPILGSEEAAFFHVWESRRTDHLLDIEVSGHEYRSVRLPLAGMFQIENCGVAVTALMNLADLEGISLQVKKGLEAVSWPARFQLLQMKPPVVFDGAHNVSGARALARSLKEIFPSFEKGMLFSFMKDKDVEGILKTLTPSIEKAWTFTLPNDRSISAKKVAGIGKSIGFNIEPIDTLQPTIRWLEAHSRRTLCFSGSFYLYGELKKMRLSYA